MAHDFNLDDLDGIVVDEAGLVEAEEQAGETEVPTGEYLAALVELRPHHNEDKGSLGFWLKMLVNKNPDASDLGWGDTDATFEWERYVYFGKVNGKQFIPNLRSIFPAVLRAFGGDSVYNKLDPFGWRSELGNMVGTVAKVKLVRKPDEYNTERNGFETYALDLSYINPYNDQGVKLNIGGNDESDESAPF